MSQEVVEVKTVEEAKAGVKFLLTAAKSGAVKDRAWFNRQFKECSKWLTTKDLENLN